MSAQRTLLRSLPALVRLNFVIHLPFSYLYAIGIAACNIGGVTIHSFSGIGLGIESAENLGIKIRKNKKAMTRWLRTKVLIIDEGTKTVYDMNFLVYDFSCQYRWWTAICLTSCLA